MNRMPRAMLAGFWISPRMETPKTQSNLFQWFFFVLFQFVGFFFPLFHRVLWCSQLSLYPKSTDTASTSCTFPFYLWVLPGTPCSPVQNYCYLCLISCMLGWTVHELEGDDAWESTNSPGELFSRIIPLAVLPSRYLKRLKPVLLRSRAVVLVFVLSFLFWF